MTTASPAMVGIEDLDLASALKGDLVAFATTPPFQRQLRDQFRRHANLAPEIRWVWAIETLLFEHRYPDGSTVLDRYVARTRDLTARQHDLVMSWRDSVYGVFEVISRDGERLHLLNLFDDLEYIAYATMGPDSLGSLESRWFVSTRVLPLGGDAWMLSGLQQLSRPEDRPMLAAIVSQASLRDPELVLRNPANRRRAQEQMASLHRSFVECFGTDRLLVAGHRVAGTHREFLDFHAARLGHSEGARPGSRELVDDDHYAEIFGSVAAVAIQHREDTGLWMLVDYDVVEATFADPGLARGRRHRDAVRGYLSDDSIPRWAIEDLADRHPQTRDAALRRVLGSPEFCWARDGAALLDRHKPGADTVNMQPGSFPVPAIVAEFAASA